MPDRSFLRKAIWGLGLTQIIGYGTLYYSFSILAPAMAREFGLTQGWVFGALSASLFAGSLAVHLRDRPLAGITFLTRLVINRLRQAIERLGAAVGAALEDERDGRADRRCDRTLGVELQRLVGAHGFQVGGGSRLRQGLRRLRGDDLRRV